MDIMKPFMDTLLVDIFKLVESKETKSTSFTDTEVDEMTKQILTTIGTNLI
jgi:hypothetical protein